MAASVVLATAGYGSIKLWQATSAQCRQSIPHPDSVRAGGRLGPHPCAA